MERHSDPEGDSDSTFNWKKPQLQHISLDFVERAKQFVLLSINESTLRVMARGAKGVFMLVKMSQALKAKLDVILSSDGLPSLLALKLKEVQDILSALLVLTGSSDATNALQILEADKCNTPGQVIRNLVMQQSYWREQERLAKDRAVASQTYVPEMAKNIEALASDEPVDLLSLAKRVLVWQEALPAGSALHITVANEPLHSWEISCC